MPLNLIANSLSSLEITHKNNIFLCQTKLRYGNKSLEFHVESVKTEENHIAVTWKEPSFGTIHQTFSKPSNDDVLNIPFHIVISPVSSMEAIIEQSFGFTPTNEPYFMIPGNLYGTNNIKNSKSKQPQLNYRGDICYPKSPVIFTRADRSTHNSVLAIQNNSIIAVRVNESTYERETPYYNGLGIDTRNYDNIDRISITIGYHHFPVHYFGKLGPEYSYSKEQEYGFIAFKSGRNYEAKGHLYISPAENRYAYEGAIKYFYEEIHQHPSNRIDRDQTVKDLTNALICDSYSYKYKYFPTLLAGLTADAGIPGDMAWTGGMQVAYPLLRASKHIPEARVTAIDFIENLVQNGVHPDSGFFYESKEKDTWRLSGWWQNDINTYNRNLKKLDAVHTAYVNGQATCYLLKSYQYAKAQGWSVENLESWFTTAKNIVDKVVEQQRYDGALGVYFDPENGEAVYFNSFQGAWFLAGISELAKLTKHEKYFKAFEKANSFYYKFLERVELWGMPMDTRDAADEEGNLAYITALKTMHEITREPSLLEKLIHALHYEFSWKFAYNTRHVNEPLKALNWPSCGGSITSSHNIHIHQMGNLVAEELYYVYKLTKDPYILNRLRDTLNWGLGTHNSEKYNFGFGKIGWATEQFFHSDGKQDDNSRIVDGGIWYDYLSWAAACVLLSSSLDIEEELYL